MKRLSTCIFFITVLFCLVGCSGQVRSTPSSTTPSSTTLSSTTPSKTEGMSDPIQNTEAFEDRVTGNYRMVSRDDGDGRQTVIDIRTLCGLLLIENTILYDGSPESSWAQEVWPDDMDELLSTELTSIRGFNQAFSPSYQDGEYWDGSMDLILQLIEGGITLTDTDGDYTYETTYERADDISWFHADLIALKNRLSEQAETLSQPAKLIGTWASENNDHAAWLSMEADGSLTYALKERGMPITVLFGAWGVDSNDFIHIAAEQMGGNQTPLSYLLVYSGDNNRIRLLDVGGDTLFPLPPVIEPSFEKVKAGWTFPETLKYAIDPDSSGPEGGTGPEWAMDILREREELETCFEAGMVMMATGETERIFDEDCTVITLGTNHGEHFVQEYIFAVAPSGQAYVYEIIGDGWITVAQHDKFKP